LSGWSSLYAATAAAMAFIMPERYLSSAPLLPASSYSPMIGMLSSMALSRQLSNCVSSLVPFFAWLPVLTRMTITAHASWELLLVSQWSIPF